MDARRRQSMTAAVTNVLATTLLVACGLAAGCTSYDMTEYRGPGKITEPKSGPDYIITFPSFDSPRTEQTFEIASLPPGSIRFLLPMDFWFNLRKHPEPIPTNLWYEITIKTPDGSLVYFDAQDHRPLRDNEFAVNWKRRDNRSDSATAFTAAPGQTYIVHIRGQMLNGGYLQQPRLVAD